MHISLKLQQKKGGVHGSVRIAHVSIVSHPRELEIFMGLNTQLEHIPFSLGFLSNCFLVLYLEIPLCSCSWVKNAENSI